MWVWMYQVEDKEQALARQIKKRKLNAKKDKKIFKKNKSINEVPLTADNLPRSLSLSLSHTHTHSLSLSQVLW